MQKLYGYVDESGQDTGGKFFIVSVVILGQERDELLKLVEQFEQESGKGKLKWGKAAHQKRLEYLRRVFAERRFGEKLRYSIFRGTTDFDLATMMAIAKAVNWRKPTVNYAVNVYVDGLSKSKRLEYRRQLRRLGVPIRQVRGITKDENNALTRLADAVAGLVRDATSGDNQEIEALFENGNRRGVLVEI